MKGWRAIFLMAGLAVSAGPAEAQQAASPSEIIDVLTTKEAVLQRDLNEALLRESRINRLLKETDEHAAWVLDNWVPKPPHE